jgi:hypothetical protein
MMPQWMGVRYPGVFRDGHRAAAASGFGEAVHKLKKEAVMAKGGSSGKGSGAKSGTRSEGKGVPQATTSGKAGWPSKEPGMKSGPGRDNATPKNAQ